MPNMVFEASAKSMGADEDHTARKVQSDFDLLYLSQDNFIMLKHSTALVHCKEYRIKMPNIFPLSCTTDHSHSPLWLAQKLDHHHVLFSSHDRN